jgi:hypothetical protein
MTAAFHRAIWTKHSALLAIFVLAVILMLPAFVRPPIFRDSWWIDIVWSEQFTQALLHGNLYPRWLPNSYDGLGAPVFYFYPPGAFYLTALGGLIGLGTYQSLLMAFFLSLCASGIGTWYFLRDWTPRPLVGAGFLLIAPYPDVSELSSRWHAGHHVNLLAPASQPRARRLSVGAARRRYLVAHLLFSLLGSDLSWWTGKDVSRS